MRTGRQEAEVNILAAKGSKVEHLRLFLVNMQSVSSNRLKSSYIN